MENKLKILSAYLPYKLGLNYKDSLEIKRFAYLTGVTTTEIETTYKRKSKGCSGDIISFNGRNNFNDLNVKPILFHLEYLTKPITLYGETFVPIEVLKKIGYGINILNEDFDEWFNDFINSDFKLYEYSFVQKLLEWKFNVFNLPEDEYIRVTDKFNPYE